MRPCPHCGEALQNGTEICPHCGAEVPVSNWEGPPPETGPGVSGNPEEERAVMLGMLAIPVAVAVGGIIIGVSLWGAWGILVGLLAGAVAFMARMAIAVS